MATNQNNVDWLGYGEFIVVVVVAAIGAVGFVWKMAHRKQLNSQQQREGLFERIHLIEATMCTRDELRRIEEDREKEIRRLYDALERNRDEAHAARAKQQDTLNEIAKRVATIAEAVRAVK